MITYNFSLKNPEEIAFFIGNFIAFASTVCVIAAVYFDFAKFHKRKGAKTEKKSIVETGSMFLFFFLFYLLLRLNLGRIDFPFWPAGLLLIIFGSAILIFGCAVNIIGRRDLGKNWANQIKIYDDQTLVSGGVYRWLRHPLYASLIWMFFGASFVFYNYLALLSNLFIFIPFMYYRAKQEEAELLKEFKNYRDYQLKTGMFFPGIF